MDGDGADLRTIFGLLKRRLWLIIAVTAIVLAAAGVALVALKPVYTATVLVLVDPTKKNLLDPDAQMAGSSTDSLRVDSEVELVKSETTLLGVAKELDLATDPEFGLKLGMREMLLAFFRIAEPRLPTGDEALASVLDNLRDAISVQRRGLTFLIAINARSARPEFSARLANAVAGNYIRQQLEAKVSSTMASRDIIRARIADAGTTVAQSETAFDDFIDQNLPRISEATGRTDLTQMRAEIDRMVALRARSAEEATLAEQGLARRDWSDVASSLKDEAVANLERQRQELASRLAGAVESSQVAVDLRASLDKVEADLNSAATRAVQGLKQDLANAQARVTDLRAQLRSSVLDGNLPSGILTSIYELQQTAEIARAQYQTLLTRQKDLDTQAFLQVADSRVVSEATPPTTPSFPNPRLMLLLAGLLGLGLGVGMAFLIENFVGGFTSVEQAQSILRLPVVSAIPRQRLQKRSGEEGLTVADSLVSAPLSVYSEAIRRIRIGVDQAVGRRRAARSDPDAPHGMVITISSAAPNEGKTTVALSLARAYALSGMSTLLIDCDLRKPSIHKHLGMQASEGLLEYLTGSAEADELKSIMTVDAGSGAQIVLGSRRSDIATDQLVAGKTFGRLIAAARRNFDVVVLDTPPIGPVVDGIYLAGMADAIVFVVKWSSTPQQEVRAAVTTITNSAGETPTVAVLNQQNANPASYRGKYAGYYAEA